MQDNRSASELLAGIEGEQARVRSIVAGKDPTMLATRPPSGKWSVVENLRHLLFAEQLHLGRFVPAGRTWSPLGLPPHNMIGEKQRRIFDLDASPAVGEVLDAWDEAHAAIRPFLAEDSEKLRQELEGNLRHMRSHIRVIERLLRDWGKPEGRGRRRAPRAVGDDGPEQSR